MPQSKHLTVGGQHWLPDTVPCTVKEVQRLTSRSVLVTLDPGPSSARFVHAPGQRVSFCLDLDGTPCIRSYNLINDVGQLPQVAVKEVAAGGSSAYFNERLQPGDVVNVAPPAGHYYEGALDFTAHHLLLFAAGSGITPLISVAKHALKARPDHKVTLFYANSSARDIMLQQELDTMARSTRFDVFHILGDGATGEDLSSGRLDHAKCQRLLEQFRVPGLPEVAFLSGPMGFMDLIADVARRQPQPMATTRFSFGQQPFLHPDDPSHGPNTAHITVKVNGITHEIQSASKQSTLLAAADEAGLAMPANCRSGICHRCKAKLVSGHTVGPGHKIPGRELPKGWILCCQQRPGSDKVEIVID